MLEYVRRLLLAQTRLAAQFDTAPQPEIREVILADSFLLSDYLRGQLRRNLLRSYVCSLSLML